MRPLYPKDLVGIVLTPMEIVSDTLERKLGLFSVDTWGNNLLTLRQFTSCVEALGMEYEDADTLRDYFHAADENGDGLIHIDQFLMALEAMASED